MPTVKVNLTIKDVNAKRIKAYAAKKNTSVSKLVDEFIEKITSSKPMPKPFSERAGGIIKDIKATDVDKIKEKYLKEKYGY